MNAPDAHTRGLLALTLLPGLGPVRIDRILRAFGTADRAMGASPAEWQRVKGIGHAIATKALTATKTIERDVDRELAQLDAIGASLIGKGSPGYPELLAELPDAPPVLSYRGSLGNEEGDRFSLGMVGSRKCSAYGIEQAERFAGVLAGAGLTIVSGGARGIDTASHRGALRAGGRTIAVLGCGLAHTYPPENAKLFDEIVERGALVSELPVQTAPTAENFPARNRIISGLSLGILVVEADARSGALITARVAVEDHGREVMALPGRVDAPTSRGTLELIKSSSAAMVTEPGDVIAQLESVAHHVHRGVHAERFPAGPSSQSDDVADPSPAKPASATQPRVDPAPQGVVNLPEPLRQILDAIERPMTPDEIVVITGLAAAEVRQAITRLEISGRIRRDGTRIDRVHTGV